MQLAFLLGSGAVLLFWLFVSAAFGITYNERPWWTERSSFIEGETLYAVGVASHVMTVEEGRQTAYDNGKKEIQNFRQSVVLDDLQIVTQMTYEEKNGDGTFSVYRLLRVPVSTLSTAPKKKQHTLLPPVGSPPAAPSQRSSVARSDCDMPSLASAATREQLDCAFKHGEAEKARYKAEEQAAQDADDQFLFQKNPEEHKKRMAIRAATRRIEAEKAELKQACQKLRRGFTREEAELIVGEPNPLGKERISYFKGPEVGYFEGRITLMFDERGRLKGWMNCP